MQMAGDSGEAEAMKAELDAAKAKASSEAPQAAKVAVSASVSEVTSSSKEESTTHNATALSFLSPPKPKLRVDVLAGPAKGDLDIRPLTTTAARKVLADKSKEAAEVTAGGQQTAAESMRSLLKVSASARGPKPLVAPWQSQKAAQITDPVNNGDKLEDALPMKAAALAVQPLPPVEGQPVSMKDNELEELRAALKEAIEARSRAEVALEAAKGEAVVARTAVAEMQQRLNDAHEESKTEEAARNAAEKRIEVLESELEALRAAAAPASEAQSKLLDKAADRAAELEGRWGLLEVQLETLQAAANAMATHIATGRTESQTVIDAVAAATQAMASEDATQPRKTRTRRKSTWRG